ncbi:MAG: cyclic nucleotide-binding domain-containing protein [Acidobacteria bacterium]|nr:cyclic nucleotide-binding domain-containing protein [Acidobacteriota bacterium]
MPIAHSAAEINAILKFRFQISTQVQNIPPGLDAKLEQVSDPLDAASSHFFMKSPNGILASLRVVPGPKANGSELRDALDTFKTKFTLSEMAILDEVYIDPEALPDLDLDKLMRDAYRACLEAGVRFFFTACLPHLMPFFEHLGFRSFGDQTNASSLGYKVPMVLLTRDHGHLYELASPLYRTAKNSRDDDEARYWFRQEFGARAPVQPVRLEDAPFYQLMGSQLADHFRHRARIIQGLSQTAAQHFLKNAAQIKVPAGQFLVQKGQADHALFVIWEGLCHVRAEGQNTPLAVLGAGDIFGEMGFLSGAPRCADVIAQTPVTVLRLSPDWLHNWMREEPTSAATILLNLAKILAQRLALSNPN